MAGTNSNPNRATYVAYLVSLNGTKDRQQFTLIAESNTTIGRDLANQIPLDDDRCSRNHCRLQFSQDRWLVRDLGSRNGTAVNGAKIAEWELTEGDILQVGKTEFLFTEQKPQDLAAASNADTSELPPDQFIEREPQIIERKSQSIYVTESKIIEAATGKESVREAFAHLYGMILQMVSAPDIRQLCETVLDRVLTSVSADIGAILLFPSRVGDSTNPDDLRMVAYRAPDDASYHKVSARLSDTVLAEQEAVLAMDLADTIGASEFATLDQMNAQSVICAPVRHEGRVLGLLHLYSLNSTKTLDADSLEFALAVTEQLALTLVNIKQKDSLTAGLERAKDQNRSLRQLLEQNSDLVGDSAEMKTLDDTITRVASSDAVALVRGESGVGKELVARSIHFKSNRKKMPFVCVNCAALTETLLESELFGHERGSFTGATGRKVGKFEQANGGTLFLDEVGEMPMTIQAKFLRVLEGHSFERVGGAESVQVDVRVVAATNRDLESAVRDNEFRKDLFYRLQILQIDVPSLRDHVDDVQPLAVAFLENCCHRINRAPLTLSPDAAAKLFEYKWPGNVRELKNVIERAVILADQSTVEPEHIQFMAISTDAVEAAPAFQPIPLEELERSHILQMLEWTDWRKAETARRLGINRSTLDRKLERYGISSSTNGE